MKDECRPANWRSSNNKRAPLWPAAFFRSRFPFAGQTHTQLLIRADGAEAAAAAAAAQHSCLPTFAHLAARNQRPAGQVEARFARGHLNELAAGWL